MYIPSVEILIVNAVTMIDSLSLSESDMPPGLMTPSDDLVVDPAYWRANPEQEHLMRQRFNESVNM